MSLLHALAMQCLRSDDNLDNLMKFDPFQGYQHQMENTDESSSSAEEQRNVAAAIQGPAALRQQTAKEKPKGGGGRNENKVGRRGRRYSVTPEMMQIQMQMAAEDGGGGGDILDGLRQSAQDSAARDASFAQQRRVVVQGSSSTKAPLPPELSPTGVRLSLVDEDEEDRSSDRRTSIVKFAPATEEGVPAHEGKPPSPGAREESARPQLLAGKSYVRTEAGLIRVDSGTDEGAAPSYDRLMERGYDDQFFHPLSKPESFRHHPPAAAKFDEIAPGPKQFRLEEFKQAVKRDREAHVRAHRARRARRAVRAAGGLALERHSSAADPLVALELVDPHRAQVRARSPRRPPVDTSTAIPGAQRYQALRAMNVPVAERTDTQSQSILAWLSGIEFFSKHPRFKEQQEELCKLIRPAEYEPSEAIAEQDEQCDSFHAIMSGAADVEVNGGRTETLDPGRYFPEDEKQLEDDQLRPATVRAKGKVTAAKLSAEDYHNCLGHVHDNAVSEQDIEAAIMAMSVLPADRRTEMQQMHIQDWVGTLRFFRENAKTEAHRVEIAKKLVLETKKVGEDVVEQGTEGDCLYAILKGTVDVIVDDSHKGVLRQGYCFGDKVRSRSGSDRLLSSPHSSATFCSQALEGDGLRTATCRAATPLIVAKLNERDYKACIEHVMRAATASPRSSDRYQDAEDIDRIDVLNEEHKLGVIAGVDQAQPLTQDERNALEHCETFNAARVFVAQAWVTQAIVRRRAAGGLKVDPPVLATGFYRNYQSANDWFYQCKKIVDTPFPYPYAQAVMLMVSFYTIMTPFMVCQLVADPVWACLISFMSVGMAVTINEVARELEDPFGHEP